MEEEEEMFPPFWLQTSDSIRQGHRSLRRSTSSVLFSSGSFVLVLLAIALVFVFFVIPNVLNFTSQIFRPHLVKKGWDSLNLVLVLFAIVCGFLSRNTTNDNNVSTPTSYDLQDHQTVFNNASMEVQKSNPSTPRRWYDQYADRTAYINSTTTSSTNSMNRGVRTSSSYPDLRQQETSWNVSRDERWRFYDDTHVANYRVSRSDQLRHHRRRHSWQEEPVQLPVEEEEAENVQTKNIPVDTFVVRPEQVSAHRQSPTSQSDPLPRPPHKATKRTYQAVGGKENSATNDNLDVKKNLPPPPSSPQPSPPSPRPLPPKEVGNKRSAGNNVKKRGVATTKEFLISSLRKKKKKQRQKSVENFDTFLSASASSSLLPPPSPPPPPPPLPPPSVFHNLFSSKKSNKPKKLVHSIPQPPSSPPPQPSPPTPRITSTARLNPQIRPTMTTQKPPLPVKVSNFNNGDDDNANSGGESPMVGIPPPPPMPPFGMPEMKFVVVQGDFVRIKSDNSSRSGSPELDEGSDQDSVSSPTMEAVTGKSSLPLESGESPKAMFCPSPDVNTKADTFIARFRAGLRLEKMNSVKEKQGRGKSNLGPDTREEEGPSY